VLIELTQALGSIGAVVRASSDTLKMHGLEPGTIKAFREPDVSLLEQDAVWLESGDHHLVTWGSPAYPVLLEKIDDPPAALFVKGNADLLWRPQIAVVGSRNPTAGGLDNARDFARELSARGLTVTSGLASGIDSAAHGAALGAAGKTIAVLGTGADQVYPASSRTIAGLIGEQGALVSGFPLGSPPRRAHFPARNRIISGLSLGTLVIEAGVKSGSLITARLAAEQGREVFALPGSIHNPMSKGCHKLIRGGARLVETADEILEELVPLAGQLADELNRQLAVVSGSETGPDAEISDGVGDGVGGGVVEKIDARTQLRTEETGEPRAGAGDKDFLPDEDYQKLWDCLGYDPKPIDTLIAQSGLTARAVSAMLLMLELKGSIEACPGSAYCRTKRG
jgi:DNA processing protein